MLTDLILATYTHCKSPVTASIIQVLNIGGIKFGETWLILPTVKLTVVSHQYFQLCSNQYVYIQYMYSRVFDKVV